MWRWIEPIVSLLEVPTLLSNPIVTNLGVAAAWPAYGRIDDRSPGVKQLGGLGSGSGAVQLSGFTGTGNGAALDLPRSVLQWTGDWHGAVTNAGALTILGNSFFQAF